MIKDYKSYHDEWLTHEKAWNGYSAKEITSDFSSSYALAEEASNAISSSGLGGISSVNISIAIKDIIELDEDREKLALFCKKIHTDAEDLIDDVFNYGVMKNLTEIYVLNPSDITCTSMGTQYQLKSIMETVILDPTLKANFSIKAGDLDKDELNDDLKTGLIDAISRYYDGNVTPYMTNASGYNTNIFNEDLNLVIEYYEYLNPNDAKNMNKFLSDLAKDGDKKFLEDIKNIKFISYTAREPYKSVFLKYLNELKISDYDYHEKDSKGNEEAQHYNSNNKKLYIRFYEENPKAVSNEGKDDPRGSYVTFFHEIGHAIDDLSLKDDNFLFWTTNVKFATVNTTGVNAFKAAESDVRINISDSVDKYIELNGYKALGIDEKKVVQAIMTYNFSGFKSNSKEEEVYNNVIKEYHDKFSKNITDATIYCGISDVYGGYTDNKLRGSYGHDNKVEDGNTYWNDLKSNNKCTGKQGKELWAEAFSRYMTSNDKAIEEMNKYFPTAMNIMNEDLILSERR